MLYIKLVAQRRIWKAACSRAVNRRPPRFRDELPGISKKRRGSLCRPIPIKWISPRRESTKQPIQPLDNYLTRLRSDWRGRMPGLRRMQIPSSSPGLYGSTMWCFLSQVGDDTCKRARWEAQIPSLEEEGQCGRQAATRRQYLTPWCYRHKQVGRWGQRQGRFSSSPNQIGNRSLFPFTP